jgi:hypothetical protein
LLINNYAIAAMVLWRAADSKLLVKSDVLTLALPLALKPAVFGLSEATKKSMMTIFRILRRLLFLYLLFSRFKQSSCQCEVPHRNAPP